MTLRRFFGSLALVLAVATTVVANSPKQRIRGVNLGGWLVIESWIKPSLFKEEPFGWQEDPFSSWKYTTRSMDEYFYCKTLGKEEASKRLSEHWDTWVTYEDLMKLAEAGINHFRIPVPFWIFGDIQEDEPWVTGNTPGIEGSSLYYLTRAVKWAKKLGVEVWIDLHTTPGSQNGYDNSGHFGPIHFMDKPENVERAIKALGDLAQHFANEDLQDTMTGVGLLNEPSWVAERMLPFYSDGFKAVRTHLPDASIFIGDSFGPRRFIDFWKNGGPEGWENFETNKDDIRSEPLHRELTSGLRGQDHSSREKSTLDEFSYAGLQRKLESVEFDESDHPGSFHKSKGMVLLDTHIYQIFDDGLRQLPAVRHIGLLCLKEEVKLNDCCWEDYEAGKTTQLKRMIGEFTAAFDQQPYGPYGYRIDGPVPEMSEERVQFLKHWVSAQMAEFEKEANLDPTAKNRWQQIEGWFFWNFKMETEPMREWDYLKGLERGFIPKLPTDRNDDRVAAEILGSCEDQRQWTLNEGDKMKGVVDPFPNYPQIGDPETGRLDDDWRHDELEEEEVEEEITQDDDGEEEEIVPADDNTLDTVEEEEIVPADDNTLDTVEEEEIVPTDDNTLDTVEEEEEVTVETSRDFNPIFVVLAIIGVIIGVSASRFRSDLRKGYEPVIGAESELSMH